MNIFREIPLYDQNFWQRLFKKLPKENALIEINNLLAKNENQISVISIDQVLQIGEKYKIDLKKTKKTKLLDLYKKYLMACLEDKKLTNKQLEILNHLKTILLLDDYDTQKLINDETEKIFSRHVRQTFDTGKMDDSKWESLENLKTDLSVSSEKAIEIYTRYAKIIIEKFIIDAVADKRYSPQEEQQLFELAKNYCADLKFDVDTDKLLIKYRLYWEIENGTLPVIKSEINLQKSESLHFQTELSWQEQRKVTTRYNYGGPTARIKIAKGIYYRLGSIGVRPQSEDVWQTIDRGTIYLTNKRIIFMGEKGNKTIPIHKILSFTPYSDGVYIQKDSGKSPFLKFSDDTELFAMILSRLMNE